MAGRTGSNRGFAAMDPQKQREIARKGGKAKGRNQSMNRDQNDQGNQERNM